MRYKRVVISASAIRPCWQFWPREFLAILSLYACGVSVMLNSIKGIRRLKVVCIVSARCRMTRAFSEHSTRTSKCVFLLVINEWHSGNLSYKLCAHRENDAENLCGAFVRAGFCIIISMCVFLRARLCSSSLPCFCCCYNFASCLVVHADNVMLPVG